MVIFFSRFTLANPEIRPSTRAGTSRTNIWPRLSPRLSLRDQVSRKVKTPDYFCLSWKSSERDFIDDILLISVISLLPHTSLLQAGWRWLLACGDQQRDVRRGLCVTVTPKLWTWTNTLCSLTKDTLHHTPCSSYFGPQSSHHLLYWPIWCKFWQRWNKSSWVRSPPRIKSNPHTSCELELDLAENFLFNKFWTAKMCFGAKIFCNWLLLITPTIIFQTKVGGVHYVDVPISECRILSCTNNPSIIPTFCGSAVTAPNTLHTISQRLALTGTFFLTQTIFILRLKISVQNSTVWSRICVVDRRDSC